MCPWLPPELVHLIASIAIEKSYQESRSMKSLTKREVKSVNTRIEEFDLEGSVYDRTFLPDELIEPGLPNFAGAVRGSVNAAIFAGSGAIQSTTKRTGLASFAGASTKCRSRLWNRNTIFPGTAWSTALSALTFHDPLNPQWFNEGFAGALNTSIESLCTFSGEAKFWAWRYPI